MSGLSDWLLASALLLVCIGIVKSKINRIRHKGFGCGCGCGDCRGDCTLKRH